MSQKYSDPNQEDTNKIYDSGALEYKNNTKDFVFGGNMFELFQEVLSGKKILDVGCAYGRDVARLRKNGFEAVGIDLSQGLLDVADDGVKEFLQLGDMTRLKEYFEKESFDGILSSCSIVHLEKDLGFQVISDCYRLLKQDGIFYISIKIADEGKNITLTKESISLPNVNKKYSYFSEIEIEEYMQRLGFKIFKKHMFPSKNDIWGTYIWRKV